MTPGAGPLTLQCSVGQADLAVGGDLRPVDLPSVTPSVGSVPVDGGLSEPTLSCETEDDIGQPSRDPAAVAPAPDNPARVRCVQELGFDSGPNASDVIVSSMGANPHATGDDTSSACSCARRTGQATRGARVGSTYEQNRQFVPKRQARYRLFDVSWGDGCEIGVGRVVSVRLGEQREKFAVLDGQAFIVASE